MTTREIRTRKRSTAPSEVSSPIEPPPCNQWPNALRLVIDYVAPESLTPPARKLRKHGRRQLAQIEASIRHFDFINPILVEQVTPAADIYSCGATLYYYIGSKPDALIA